MEVMMKRTFAIGDIHGCNETFRQFIFQSIAICKTDTVYLLGDYIDRGPDSKGFLDTIMSLIHDGFDVRPLLGNHEDMLLQAISAPNDGHLLYWLLNGGDATLDSFGVQHPAQIPREYVSFLDGLPLYLCSPSHLFVHGGLDFRLDDPLSDAGRNAMLWDRQGYVNPAKIGDRTLVGGHTIMDLKQITASLNSRFIHLDNGCFLGGRSRQLGNLVGLELESNRLVVLANRERW
jgi:serine/threonine protein phosphatase 1